MTGERIRGWIETLWPIAVGLVLVVIAYSNLGSRLTAVEEKAQRAEIKAEANSTDANEIKRELTRLSTIIEERLPRPPR